MITKIFAPTSDVDISDPGRDFRIAQAAMFVLFMISAVLFSAAFLHKNYLQSAIIATFSDSSKVLEPAAFQQLLESESGYVWNWPILVLLCIVSPLVAVFSAMMASIENMRSRRKAAQDRAVVIVTGLFCASAVLFAVAGLYDTNALQNANYPRLEKTTDITGLVVKTRKPQCPAKVSYSCDGVVIVDSGGIEYTVHYNGRKGIPYAEGSTLTFKEHLYRTGLTKETSVRYSAQ